MMLRSSRRILQAVSSLAEENLSYRLLETLRKPPCFLSTTATRSSSQSTNSTTEESRSGAEPSESENCSELEAKLAKKDKYIEERDKLVTELEDKYKRSLAENQNVLQRSQKMVEEARLFAIRGFSKDLLEIADILEKATTSVPKEELDKNSHLKNLFEGLTMTEAQLHKVFNKNGLEKMNPEGEKFNPHFHEAVFQFDAPDKEDGTVAVVQKIGYTLNGITLRPALVGVVKKST
ncbi:predicted protein [Nematostella vectensis]|uniref:GrpE protein homolog n=1 Tax=Nematostella vectensis TaxID=45351 RepID=A7RMW1_NEMVE|nr:grpE protein homolog 1, mitochondrial [Nematostella vectensis]EDO47213.1 predicted protein [Nematostella vectensis]|eukprot:XP_001639276.1 predicted protein [Nematostella vectensis]